MVSSGGGKGAMRKTSPPPLLFRPIVVNRANSLNFGSRGGGRRVHPPGLFLFLSLKHEYVWHHVNVHTESENP